HIVGAATGLPLRHEEAAFRAPLEGAGYRAEELFYFGESVLLPAFRGRGIGHAFFDAREAQARGLPGIGHTACCAGRRAADDPRRPEGARALEPFWRGRGYAPLPGVAARFPWTEVGSGAETVQTLDFWARAL
ncbi:MAG: GNAT family N-acetyltransferase, partial [Alphaproteobacteria bacterium]|nr:GNAT family N-acetyltransferase [Alphaproteobacteria bacterium]